MHRSFRILSNWRRGTDLLLPGLHFPASRSVDTVDSSKRFRLLSRKRSRRAPLHCNRSQCKQILVRGIQVPFSSKLLQSNAKSMIKGMRQLEENRLDLLDRRLTRGIWSVSRSPVDAIDDHAAGSHSVGAVHAPTQALVKATCTCSGGKEPFLSAWPQLDMPRRSVSHIWPGTLLHSFSTGTQASKGARVLDAEVGAPV